MISQFIKKSTQSTLLFILPLILTGFLTGCASVKITSSSQNENLAPSKSNSPTVVAISPYMTITKHNNAQLDTKYLDQQTGFIYIGRLKDNPPIPNKLGIVVANSISNSMDKDSQINPTIQDKPPKKGLWVTGQITEENKGSRALRAIIGLGAGKTKLETKTFVYNLDKSKKSPWLTIWTTGHSGREPGAIFSAMPSPIIAFNILGVASTAATLINHSNKGLTQDAKRTGKTVGKEIRSKFKF